MKFGIASCGFRANISRCYGIYPYPIYRILQSCTPYHHIQTCHCCVIYSVTWPGLLSCRGWKYGGWSFSYSEEWHTYRQKMHRRSYINLLYQVPLRQIAINSTHKINNAVTEKNCIESSFKISKHCMDLISNLQGINKVNFVRINLFLWIIWRQSRFLKQMHR